MLNTIYPDRRRRFGDRYDAFRLRNPQPFFTVIPHIMRDRTGSMVFFEEDVDISHLEQFVRRLRREGDMPDLSVVHVVMAAAMRLVAENPGLNRFVAGRKLFARNHIALSIAVKPSLSRESEETTVKTLFLPTDSLPKVWERLREGLLAAKDAKLNGTSRTAELFKHMPVVLVRFAIFVFRNLDQVGHMPKTIQSVSPFHTSAFIVDIGSTGIDSIYHHLYDFGTCPIFISIGRKSARLKVNRHGQTHSTRVVNFKFVVDERVCDGYYYAKAMGQFRYFLSHPEVLMESLEKPVPDPWL